MDIEPQKIMAHPLAAGIIIGIGDVTLQFTDDFSLGGIALGTIVTIAVTLVFGLLGARSLSLSSFLCKSLHC